MGSNNQQAQYQCRERCHLGTYFVVWDYAVAVCRSKDSEEFFVSVPHIAAACGISRWTVTRFIKWLVKVGWFEELIPAHRGNNGTGCYRPVLHEEWVARYGDGQCLKASGHKQAQASTS